MTKNIQCSTKIVKVTKKGTEFNRMISNKDKLSYLCGWHDQITEAAIDQIAADLIEWANKPTSFVFGNFLCDYGIPLRKYYKWMQRFPQLEEAHTYAMMKVGGRREQAACEHSPVLWFKNLPAYCPITKGVEQFKKDNEENVSELIDLSNCFLELKEAEWPAPKEETPSTTSDEKLITTFKQPL